MTTETTRQTRPSRAGRNAWTSILTLCALLLLCGVVRSAHAAPGDGPREPAADAAEWRDADIGTPPSGETGETRAANGHFMMRALGEDITRTPTAQLHFHYIPIQGDFNLIARITDKDQKDRLESRAGIM